MGFRLVLYLHFHPCWHALQLQRRYPSETYIPFVGVGHVGHVGHVGVRPSLQWMEANPVLEPPLPSESCVRAVFMG